MVGKGDIKAITTAAAAGLAVVLLIVGLVIGLVVGPQLFPREVEVPGEVVTETVERTIERTVEVEVPPLRGEILIGALLPLTGSLASYGENSKEAILIAEKEINAWLKEIGATFTIKVIIEDTETKPDVALTKLQSLAARGVKIVIGPQTSAEVRNLKGFADANKILLISQSSTAPELAIPGDFIYRFTTDDTIQGPVIAKVMWEDGIRFIVPVWRGDAWGDGLMRTSVDNFIELGGQADEGIRYAPDKVEKEGFGPEVDLLASKVQAAVEKFGKDKVGVLFISFAEAVDMFVKASAREVLGQVRWYGSDGTAQLEEMVQEPIAAEFAVKVRFINPIFAATKSEKYEALVEQIRAKLGRIPDTYAVAAYDELWVITLSLMAVQKYDAEAVKEVLPIVAKNFFGASGWIVLNEAGDRAFADYELWEILKVDDKFEWKQTGIYNFATGSITWLGG